MARKSVPTVGALSVSALISKALEDPRVTVLGVRALGDASVDELCRSLIDTSPDLRIAYFDGEQPVRRAREVLQKFTREIFIDARPWKSDITALHAYLEKNGKISGVSRQQFLRFLRSKSQKDILALAETFYIQNRSYGPIARTIGTGKRQISVYSGVDQSLKRNSFDSIVKHAFSPQGSYYTSSDKVILLGSELPNTISGPGYWGFSFDATDDAAADISDFSPYQLGWRNDKLVVEDEDTADDGDTYALSDVLEHLYVVADQLERQVPSEQIDQRILLRVKDLGRECTHSPPRVTAIEFLVRSISDTLGWEREALSDFGAQIARELTRTHGLLRRASPQLQRLELIDTLPETPYRLPTDLIERFAEAVNREAGTLVRDDAKQAVTDVAEDATANQTRRAGRYFQVAAFFNMLWKVFQRAPEIAKSVESWDSLVHKVGEIIAAIQNAR